MIMLKEERLDLYRKMKLWIHEMPDDSRDIEKGDIFIYKANKDISWLNGILCLELRIAPRAASNYAMLNFKFTKDNSDIFKILFMQSKKEQIISSDIAVPGDIVSNDIVKVYHDTLTQLFDELSTQNIFPSGILEILGGRRASIGSSSIAVTIVARLLISLFELGEKLEAADINRIILEGCKYKGK